MKKLFISMLAVAFSVSAMATSTATAHIKLVGSNATYAVSMLQLNEDNERTNAYESGYDAESMMTQSNLYSVLLYSYIGAQPCEMIFAKDLDGQEISLKTNKVDADYTLQFSNVSGRALKLYDNVTATLVDITEGGSYAFSVEAAQVGQHEVLNRFTIGDPTPKFCFNYNILEINGHQGETLVVKKGTTEIANLTLGAFYKLDLSGETGRLVVTLNGQDYQIDANPTLD
jgi:hypothetical protein